MKMALEMTQARCKELAGTSSFYRLVCSEHWQIEDIGWEHLVKLSDDLSSLSFRVIDKKEREHVFEIHLDKSYPNSLPSIAADMPYLFDLTWFANSRLKDVLLQFHKHLERLEDFWNTLESIDRNLSVMGPKQYSNATCYRQISIGNDCSLMLHIDARAPKAFPECRFIGPDPAINSLRQKWHRNEKKWSKDKPIAENLSSVLEIRLPSPLDTERTTQTLDCGICYAEFLLIDEEVVEQSCSRTDFTCDNANCGRAFHSICLVEWLQSITTTRRSYGVLFGNCPYCSVPVAVRVNNKTKGGMTLR